MGEASASFGNSQNYDEEGPSKSTEKSKKKPRRGSKCPADDSDRNSSAKRGSTPKEPKYKCELCSFSTAYLYSINRHAVKVHKDVVVQEDGSIKACFEKLETKKEPVTLPSLFSSTSAPSQEFDGLQEFNNIVDSLGVSTSTQWSDPSTPAEQMGTIKFATTDGTQINIFRTEYPSFSQNDSHFITFEKADESSATVGDTLLNGYVGSTLQPPPPETKFLHHSTSSSLGNGSQHSHHAPEVKTENDASNGPGKKKNSMGMGQKKAGKSKKRKSSLATSDSGNDDLSSDSKGGPDKKKRKQNAPVSLIKSTVSKCPLCNFSSKYPSNTGRHFQSVHKAECKEVVEGRLTLEGIVKKEEMIEKPSPPKKKKPPPKKTVELKIPQVSAPSSQEFDSSATLAPPSNPGPTPAEQLQQFVQNEHLELYAGPDTDNIEPIASFIDSLLSGCVGPNEWGLQPVEAAYAADATHFTQNPSEAVTQSHNIIPLEPQLNGMGGNYLTQYTQVQQVQQVHQVQAVPQQLEQYHHPTPVTEAHSAGYHPLPQIQSAQNQVPVADNKKKPTKTNQANTPSAQDAKEAALNRRREKRREQRLKKIGDKNPGPTTSSQVEAPTNSNVGISVDNPTAITSTAATGVDNSLRNEVRAAVEGTYETLVTSHSLTTNPYHHASFGTGMDTPMNAAGDSRVNSSVTTTSLEAMGVQVNYQMPSGIHNLMETVQVATVGTAVDTPVVTPAGTALPVSLEWSSQLYHPAPNQAIPVTDGAPAYTTLNVAAMNLSDVHTYLPIDFNELSHTTTTLQPLDPTIVISNNSTSPNPPVLSIPQPMVPLSVEDNSFFEAPLLTRSGGEVQPTAITTTTATLTSAAITQPVFSDTNSSGVSQSESIKSEPGPSKPMSPRVKSEKTAEEVEAAKQDRLAKRREKYRLQQEMKKKGLQPQPVADNKPPPPRKSQVSPEVLEARRKRELERRKEKRKQLAEQKKQLQNESGQVPGGSYSVPNTPLGVKSEARSEDVPSVSSSVPSNNTEQSGNSDNSGSGITSPESQIVCGGEPGALSAPGETVEKAGCVGISNVIVGDQAVVVVDSVNVSTTTTTRGSSESGVIPMREKLQDFELNTLPAPHHTTTTTTRAENTLQPQQYGVTTSDLKPVFGAEGSSSTNFQTLEFKCERTTDFGELIPRIAEAKGLIASTFAATAVGVATAATPSYRIQNPARGALMEQHQDFLKPTFVGETQALQAFGFMDYKAGTLLQPVPSVNFIPPSPAPPPWEPVSAHSASGMAMPCSSSTLENAPAVSVSNSAEASRIAYAANNTLSDSKPSLVGFGNSDSVRSDGGQSENFLPPSGNLLVNSEGSRPRQISTEEAKKEEQRAKQREYRQNWKLRKQGLLNPCKRALKKEEKLGGGTKISADSAVSPGGGGGESKAFMSTEELKEQKRRRNLEQQRERRRKQKEQKKLGRDGTEGTPAVADGAKDEAMKKIKFIKVDHSPQVQNCPDCDFQTDSHYKLLVHKTVHDALNNMSPFVRSMIEATGKVESLLKFQPDRDPFKKSAEVTDQADVQKDPVQLGS